MEPKHAIVINNNGNKVEFVLVNYIDENGKIEAVPSSYIMQDGESLVYDNIPTALSMVKPRWTGTAWQETATPEEIAAAQPEPVEHQPTDTEITMLAVAELYEKYEKVLGGATS